MHKQCSWCNVTMGIKESDTSLTPITNPCTNETVYYDLCYYCRKFPSEESMKFYKEYLVNWALLNIPITLDSIENECVNGEWRVTLKITVYYGSELIPVRQGWVA